MYGKVASLESSSAIRCFRWLYLYILAAKKSIWYRHVAMVDMFTATAGTPIDARLSQAYGTVDTK